MRAYFAAALVFAGALSACDNEPTTPSRTSDGSRRADAALIEAANSWTPKAPMDTARDFLVAIAAPNGLVYAIGGYGSAVHATVEAYQPSTNRWSLKAPLPVPLWDASGAVAIGENIYVPGGRSGPGGLPQKSLYIYNTRTNIWTPGTDLPITSASGAAAGIDGRVYVFTQGYLHRYDPATKTWVELARAPRQHAYGVMRPINRKLYVVGGYETAGSMAVPAASADSAVVLDVYDPTTNHWTRKAPMPTSRAGATAQVLGGKLYVIGGCALGSEKPLAKVEAYDPTTNKWTTRTPLPGARCLLGSGVTNGKIFAVGGANASFAVVATNLAYTP